MCGLGAGGSDVRVGAAGTGVARVGGDVRVGRGRVMGLRREMSRFPPLFSFMRAQK